MRAPASLCRPRATKSQNSPEKAAGSSRGAGCATIKSIKSQNPSEAGCCAAACAPQAAALSCSNPWNTRPGGYGKIPRASSTKQSASDHVSESKLYGRPAMRSGLMYVTVPTHDLAIACECPSCPATPKSEILTSPRVDTNRFEGLMSRWMTLCSPCKCLSPSSTCLATLASTRSGTGPACASAARLPASMCSSTMETAPSP
mmetsp:Transcript_14998/g.46662  ORF Transcript_14998/g.46662 Transcript_14998/m.46662 type:complete len:202 (+) Transcript_14998:493-1098(+)